MRLNQNLAPARTEERSDAAPQSHRLMLRSALITRQASGLLVWLPMGLLALERVKRVVREEMAAIGALEISCPSLVPRKRLEENGLANHDGDGLFHLTDRRSCELCLTSTHEEAVLDLVRSNRTPPGGFPTILYQIGRLFRDETGVRTGEIDEREHLAKESFSFDTSREGLRFSFNKMYQAYRRIFDRLHLAHTMVTVDQPETGQDVSHEFVVESPEGQTAIVLCSSTRCGHAANIDKAPCSPPPDFEDEDKDQPIREVHTPGVRTPDNLAESLNVSRQTIVKTLIYQADGELVAVLTLGDHEPSEIKIARFLQCARLEAASPEGVLEATGGPIGFSGPIGLNPQVRVLSDLAVARLRHAVIGANKPDTHFVGARIDRDFSLGQTFDLRRTAAGDPCTMCGADVEIVRCIQLGQIVQRGTASALKAGALFTDVDGTQKPLLMSHNELAIDRSIVAVIEQNRDEKGIVWPMAVAPFQVVVIPVDMDDLRAVSTAMELYQKLLTRGLSVLIDDRDEPFGFKLSDAELVGIPIRITVSETSLATGEVEWTLRRNPEKTKIKIDLVVEAVAAHVRGEMEARP